MIYRHITHIDDYSLSVCGLHIALTRLSVHVYIWYARYYMVLHPQNIVIIYSYVSLTRAVVASSSGDFFFWFPKTYTFDIRHRGGVVFVIWPNFWCKYYSYIYIWRYYVYICARVCAYAEIKSPRTRHVPSPLFAFCFFRSRKSFFKNHYNPVQ